MEQFDDIFDAWKAGGAAEPVYTALPSGKNKRKRRRTQPAGTLVATTLNWTSIRLSYTYQHGELWGLFRDGVLINLLPSGGAAPYSGVYTDTDLAPGTVYTYTLRRSGGTAIVAQRVIPTWAHNFPEQYDMPESGDVKTSLRDADHSNWYLLDGRLINTLPASAQAVATSLGYAVTLPDASECCVRGSATYLGEITGTNSVTLSRNQLPDVTLSGTTGIAGEHRHTVMTVDNGGVWDGYIAQGASPTLNAGRDTEPAGSHSHTLTTESINGGVTQQAIDLTPKSFNVNLFIWLM
jgi:hypothetical protein